MSSKAEKAELKAMQIRCVGPSKLPQVQYGVWSARDWRSIQGVR